ncbi:MAG: hypothetical protein WC581_02615 [Thermodesulfovibrionales bacterium]
MDQYGSDVWVYDDKSGRKESWIPLSLFLILLALFLFLDKNVYFYVYLTVLVFFLGLSIYITAEHTTVSIDRLSGLITENKQVLFLNKRKTFNADNFTSVELAEKPVTVQEGYIVLYYSVVLKGENTSFEILSSKDEGLAKKHFRDIKAFLRK